MKITLLGATGGTGRQVLTQGCAAGHEITAVVRDRTRLNYAHARLRVITAEVTDPDALGPAVEGADAVVSTLGVRGRTAATICADGVTSAITAMKAAGVHRLVVTSAAGLTTDGDDVLTRFLAKPILQAILRGPFADMRRMEELVRATNLDWTIVRPPMLTDGPPTGRYRSRLNANVRGGFRISRADVADYLLRCVTEDGPLRAAVGIG